ncbi:MAG: alpha/beta hydrolase [Myxococcota bacterium]
MTLRRESFGEFSLIRRPAKGDRQVVVHFAHATGFNAYTYAPLFEMLDPGIDLFAMDARGHGLSNARAVPSELRSWQTFEADLVSLLATLRRPVVLAGHSMGGTVSLAVAAHHPDDVASLVLVDPVMPPPWFGWTVVAARAVGLTPQVPIARAASKRRMDFPSKETAVDNFVGKGAFRTWPREWIEAYVEGGTIPTDDGVRLSCAREWESRVFAMATARPFRHVRKLRCPTTLFARQGDGPPLPNASRDAFMRIRPETRLLNLADVSHFMTMERPELVRDEIHRAVDLARSKLG